MTTNSLYDAAIRQQLYIEGIKRREAGRLIALENKLASELTAMFSKRGIKGLGELSKKEYRAFQAELNRRMRPHINKANRETRSLIRAFIAADYAVTKNLFSTIAGTGPTYRKPADLWASFRQYIMPGTGSTVNEMLASGTSHMMAQTNKLLAKSYAENQTATETLQGFTGTRANKFKDGLRGKLNNSFNAMLNTVFQGASSFINSEIGSKYFERYKWVSILDSRTTDICRSRDGKVYVYGEGPIPPAHYNCRSIIVPVSETLKDSVNPRPEPVAPIPEDDGTFYRWILRQPQDVQTDILGKTWTKALRAGKLSPDQIAGFDTVRELTVDGYRLKAPKIVQ